MRAYAPAHKERKSHFPIRRPTGGHSLDARTREAFEPAFGHDFGQVRVHADSDADRSAREQGALAYTLGNDIVFKAGQYRPHTPAGDELLAHELTHVVQQHQTGVPAIQRQADPATTAVDDEIAKFQAGAPYFRFNHRVANGLFDAIYLPPNFNILVRVAFHLYPMEHEVQDPSKEPHWTTAQAEQWKRDYLTQVSEKWTRENLVLYCREPGWEHLTAQVVVRFMDNARVREIMAPFPDSDVRAHWLLNVGKVPEGQQSAGITHIPGGTPPMGMVDLDSEALKRQRKTGGHFQRTAVHESGHMLGLADLYEGGNPALLPGFQKRAEAELGAKVKVRNDARLMSVGERVDPPDAISFVEAIRATTGKDWSIMPVRRPLPPRQIDDINDRVPRKEVLV